MKRPLDKFDWLLFIAAISVVLLDSFRDRIPVPDIFPDTVDVPVEVDSTHVLIIRELDPNSDDYVESDVIDAFGGDGELVNWCAENDVTWRLYDPQQDQETDGEEWVRQMLKTGRESVPWIYAATPSDWHSGPLDPDDIEGTKNIIKGLSP